MNRPYIQKQRGTTMLLTLVFLIGLFGAIGLATDSGHVLVNKTRLQNALDAAALSAAISVNGDPAHNTANATTAGKATFDLFKGTTGNSELSGISADAGGCNPMIASSSVMFRTSFSSNSAESL